MIRTEDIMAHAQSQYAFGLGGFDTAMAETFNIPKTASKKEAMESLVLEIAERDLEIENLKTELGDRK